MKRTAIKILIFSVTYFVAVFLVNSIFIRPGIIRVYGFSPSENIFQQAFIGVFVPISLFLPAFFTTFWDFNKQKLKKMIVFTAIYVALTFLLFLIFVVPAFSFMKVLVFILILICFTFLTYSIAYFLATINLPNYWRSLIVVLIVFAVITNVLWMNPIFEAYASNVKTLSFIVNTAVTVNPAAVTIEKVFEINIFRSGNLYSHTGGEGLSLIGDYFTSVGYFISTVVYPVIYAFLGFVFLIPSLLIRRLEQKRASK